MRGELTLWGQEPLDAVTSGPSRGLVVRKAG